MRKHTTILVLLAFLAMPAVAQETTATDADRQWDFTIYLWGTGIKGDIGVGAFQAPIDASFSDVLNDLDFGFFGHLEYHRPDSQWGGFADFASVDVSASQNRPFGRIASAVDTMWIEGALTYNLATRESPFEVFAGFRYWDLDASIGFTASGPGVPPQLPPSGVTLTSGADWADFMFGARYAPRISHNWWLTLRGDYATGDSDTVNAVGHLTWRFAGSTSLIFGWRYMDLDYDEGSGITRQVLDLQFNGPAAAISFTF